MELRRKRSDLQLGPSSHILKPATRSSDYATALLDYCNTWFRLNVVGVVLETGKGVEEDPL